MRRAKLASVESISKLADFGEPKKLSEELPVFEESRSAAGRITEPDALLLNESARGEESLIEESCVLSPYGRNMSS